MSQIQTGWYGVDLDGTLADYTGWSEGKIGQPIPRMVRRVRKMLAEGKRVKIFTARVGPRPNHSPQDNFVYRETLAIRLWCLEHLGEALEVTATKDFGLVELYDDRAKQVRMNTGELLEDDYELTLAKLREYREAVLGK